MSAPALPDFENTIRLGEGGLDAAELAECHGLLAGLLCREPASTASDFKFQLSAMKLAVDPSAELDSALTQAHACTVRQLQDEEFGFALWLPDDDEPLEERIIALGRWCSGFLAGLVCGGQLDALSPEAAEAIEDLQQIAQAEMTSQGSEESDAEEDEIAFAEIVEYVRVVALMMHEDFRGPGQHEVIH